MNNVSTHDCDGCDSEIPGIRVDATNHTKEPVPFGYTVIERCDQCQIYDSDIDAAQAYNRSMIAIISDDDGNEAVLGLIPNQK